MAEQLQNFGSTTVNETLSDSDTTVTVSDGTVFPSSGNFRVNCEDEIMLVTARSGNDLTVTRGAESTTAAAHASGSTIKMVLTAGGLAAYTAMTFIDSYEATGDVTSMELTGIPQTYTHLVLKARLRTDRSAGDYDYIKLRFGGTGGYDTGSNYDWYTWRRGSGDNEATGSAATFLQIGDTTSYWAAATTSDSTGYAYVHWTAQFDHYREATWRTVYGWGGGFGNTAYQWGEFNGRWKNTTADNLDRIQLTPGAGTYFKSGSLIELYGIGGG